MAAIFGLKFQGHRSTLSRGLFGMPSCAMKNVRLSQERASVISREKILQAFNALIRSLGKTVQING